MADLKYHEPGTIGYAHSDGMRLLKVKVTDTVIWLKEPDRGRSSIRHIVDVLEVLDEGLLSDRPDLLERRPSVRFGDGNVEYDRLYLTLEEAELGKQREIEIIRSWSKGAS